MLKEVCDFFHLSSASCYKAGVGKLSPQISLSDPWDSLQAIPPTKWPPPQVCFLAELCP